MLYIASLKLVCMKGAKLLTDADGNRISDNTQLDSVLAGFDDHVAECFGFIKGKIYHIYIKLFLSFCLNFVI